MKKALILSLMFLVSCSTLAPQEPFKAGDTFLLTGTAKDGSAVSQRFTLRGKGDWDDGEWNYDADGTSRDSASVNVAGDQDSVSIFDYAELANGQAEGTQQILACVAGTDGPGWRSSDEGRLFKDSKANIKNMIDEWKSKSRSAVASSLIEATGTCTISRP
ncbi:hypothetical protein [Deinococcus hohokamensis]|uniref:Lipoprotein n=1 Tax=Deinococcus hohokamensis TaxID=309883 RepID=A0ABV9ID19_9DEIO